MRRVPTRPARLAAAGGAALALPAALLMAGAGSASAAPSLPDACATSGDQVVCTYDTPGKHTFTVPDGVTEATVAVYGAQGGHQTDGPPFIAGGKGGSATATIPIGGYETLQVHVGGRGGDYASVPGENDDGGDGGVNGGGAGGDGFSAGGGGGGASDVRTGAGLDTRMIVAGGGGGATNLGDGGGGGGLSGQKGAGPALGGGGGTQTAGGTGGQSGIPSGEDGQLGVGGAGATDLRGPAGGGGGGGYYGGGGGGDGRGTGGGGSGFGPEGTKFQTGVHSGDGLVTITYTRPAPAAADLAVAKTCTPGVVAPGQRLHCKITVTNNGPADATGVTVPDPIGFRVSPTGPIHSKNFTCQRTGKGGNVKAISCTRKTMPNGASATITFDLTVRYALPGGHHVGPGVTLTNTVTVSADSPADPKKANNTATATAHTPACTIDKRDATHRVVIRGTSGDDVICAPRAGSIIAARGGNDIIFTAGGLNTVAGGAGDDRLYGANRTDIVNGGPGDDVLYGGPGTDILNGGPGADTINGGPGVNICHAETTTHCR